MDKNIQSRLLKACVTGRGIRLDMFLKNSASVTRLQAREMIDQGFVWVNMQVQRKYHRIIRNSDDVRYMYYDRNPVPVIPCDLPIKVIYTNKDFIAVNKEAGMLVHPTAHRETNTVANCVKALYPENTIHVINRLDRETTGIVVVALNKETANVLAKIMESRDIHKEYLCLVHGTIAHAGEITAELSKDTHKAGIRTVVLSGGQSAHTVFEPVYKNKTTTLLKVILKTGRTHQIRVHMQHIGHPVVGDKIYGDMSLDIKLLGAENPQPGQMLHAHKMEFIMPGTGERINLSAEPSWDNINQ
jgi:23S rRNA pseudouridine1911/1915/1917 synthase